MVDPKICSLDIQIPYKDKKIEAVINHGFKKISDLESEKFWIVLTHGAGGDLRAPQLSASVTYLASKSYAVMRFTCKGLNIKYRINVFSEVLKYLNENYNPKGIFIGGRSMGARAAAMLVPDNNINSKILGIICLSYPLHKVKNITELRDEPLLKLQKPIFFLSGTKDEMCERTVMENVFKKMKSPLKVHWLEGYDHSAKSLENYKEAKYLEAFSEISHWLSAICD